MAIFRSIVFIATLAGLMAGLAMTAMQFAGTVPLILKAETFENAELPHEHAAVPNAGAPHSHDEDEWAPADGFERSAYTALANVVTAIGFALLLVAAAELRGGMTGWRQGVVWGLAGFAVFTLAPGLGLPPELPAMPAAELDQRQIWWVATALATGLGLALLVFKRSAPLAILGLALIVAPHLIGAPKPDSFESPIPTALAHDFGVMVSVISFVFWVVLGGTAGFIRSRVQQIA
ncbi:CbtA family protein [Microvirga tunisiensis]|uniref:CbtA family protein n=1 Tax=Microvirga tunisiensis TaxID=2108360 RepID=A0A5N7MN31_9HYPH|nr:CbtA family protein [Microvirga tunisiensis]MPR10238.1 CbtA family protein [Microvirga tunisiensis]MPR28441.1 CbtA family protein [Microvirga tunisiensis]